MPKVDGSLRKASAGPRARWLGLRLRGTRACRFNRSMTSYVALLRAVNVSGTGKLLMTDLKALCEAAGFSAVKTYIASGNVVFQSKLSAGQVKAKLEAALHAHAGKPIGVLLRTAAEMAELLAENPFPEAPPNKVLTLFLDEAPAADALESLKGREQEQIKAGKREIHVFYPAGQGVSKLLIPAAKAGTGRNRNTIAKLAEMAAGLSA